MLDFHSHVLPEMDDGSRSVEESLQLLRRSAEQGVDTMVATPHFYAERENPSSFLRRRAVSLQALRAAMDGLPALPRLVMGAEVRYFDGMGGAEALRRLQIGGSGLLLVEMPAGVWTERMLGELRRMRDMQGLTPVIAHIDRYVLCWRDRRLLDRLEEQGALIQANAAFFLRRNTSRAALRLLREERLHLLGSDCHSIGSRPPELGAAVAVITKTLGCETLERLERIGTGLLSGSDAEPALTAPDTI